MDDGRQGVQVVYGTSRKVSELHSGEFSITTAESQAFAASGLSFPTKFDLRKLVSLPYTDEWFRVPPAPRYGQTPKLGTLHASLVRRLRAAAAATLPPPPN